MQALKSWSEACRITHLVKNILLFLPLILAHRTDDLALWKTTVIGFIAYSFMSGGIYLVNDVLDAKYDNDHPGKQQRVLVTGQLQASQLIPVSMLMITLSLGISAFCLPILFTYTLISYLIIALIYSTIVKHWMIMDVLTLAGFYSLRLFAGAVLANVVLSSWLFAFSLFFFFSLAIAKRQIELLSLQNTELESIPGRPYKIVDTFQLQILGAASGIAALVLLALYIYHLEIGSSYQRPYGLWLSFYAILYWLTRLWILIWRRELTGDPIAWALRDRNSYFALMLIVISYFVAS